MGKAILGAIHYLVYDFVVVLVVGFVASKITVYFGSVFFAFAVLEITAFATVGLLEADISIVFETLVVTLNKR